VNATPSTAQPFSPDYTSPPGDTIADLLEEHEMTQTALALRLGVSLKHVNQIVKGAASISAELALGLERVFGVPAGFWLSREANFQARLARLNEREDLEKALSWAEKFPVRELKARGFVPPDAKGPDLSAALLQFFGVASHRQWRDLAVAFRKSQKFGSDVYALWAWLRVGEIRAQDIQAAPFNPDRFREALATARRLTRLSPKKWHSRLVDECAEAGVAVVVEEAFKKARANGATRWLSPTKALIQLSLRGSWEDIFWFTFFHEAGHVLLHRKKEIFVEPATRPSSARADKEWLRREQEADRFAAKTLIPPPYDTRLSRLRLNEVQAFADRLEIAPAVVIGRLQHDGLLPYSQGNRLRRRLVFTNEEN
jgi:HTH-type transcriptional regulator/antitoxin HigA